MIKRGPSIKQVADAAGASTATVSNVFSGKKPVKPELAARVRDAAEALGYRANRAASNLRSGQSRVVTVMVPDLSDPFFTSLITEIEDHARRDGYEIIVANARDEAETEQGRVAALLSWQPAGMIVIPISDDIPEQLTAVRGDVPIVVTDRGVETEGFDAVRVDNFAAGAMVADHLVELGHRRILLAASDMRLRGIRERCRGAFERMEAVGGSTDIVEIGPVPHHGADHLARWLDRHPWPTAIFAVTDMTTLATLTCLAERKAEIGSDVSVVGFDDYPWMSARRTPITAVRQPIEGIADAVWTTLTRRMEGDETTIMTKPLSCSLSIRASTQPVAGQGNKVPRRGRRVPAGR
ncbi:LacI family DNA-binding transcriptional regulator [Bauldia sp.]|uniref:LacI family DNA-binding transcriptional regulator n=1 Tax=Bauldia sp. TaxID=2575872 RepID=UPI003BA9C70E